MRLIKIISRMNRLGKCYKINIDKKNSYVYIFDKEGDDWVSITFNFDNSTIYTNDLWQERLIRYSEELDFPEQDLIQMIFLYPWRVKREYG